MEHLRKTRIVCTIGPATQSVEMLGRLVDAGMDVVRMNFSHGTHEFHDTTIRNLKKCLNTRPDRIVATMLDTKGPEIRSGKLIDGKEVELVAGDQFVFHADPSVVGDQTKVGVDYLPLCSAVSPGDVILVNDGLISCKVVEIRASQVVTKIQNGGMLGETQGINLPGKSVELPALTDKDISDLQFGIDRGIDMVSASFTRKAQDVLEIRQILRDTPIKIISKIENQEGLDNFDEILAVSDGIMVARGDLGVEIPLELLSPAQKSIISRCNQAGKPCITATQMLENMILYPRPTRAEVLDVFNAVLDGSDCLMLSGETAKGNYPVKVVDLMARICIEAERYSCQQSFQSHSRAQAISLAATNLVHHCRVSLVVCFDGVILRLDQSNCIVVCVVGDETTARQCKLFRGSIPFMAKCESQSDVIGDVVKWSLDKCLARPGDEIVVVGSDGVRLVRIPSQ